MGFPCDYVQLCRSTAHLTPGTELPLCVLDIQPGAPALPVLNNPSARPGRAQRLADRPLGLPRGTQGSGFWGSVRLLPQRVEAGWQAAVPPTCPSSRRGPRSRAHSSAPPSSFPVPTSSPTQRASQWARLRLRLRGSSVPLGEGVARFCHQRTHTVHNAGYMPVCCTLPVHTRACLQQWRQVEARRTHDCHMATDASCTYTARACVCLVCSGSALDGWQCTSRC